MQDPTAAALIRQLALEPHPEGGWYRQTWREGSGGRGRATAIYFLLEAGQRSHWHRVDAAEFWFFHAGTPLSLKIAEAEGAPVETILLGPDPIAGQCPQAMVPQGWWQATETNGGWGLVSCVVSPGFEFDGFELAPPGWTP